MKVTDDGDEHEVGNPNCKADMCGCYGAMSGYPDKCPCGGLIHAQFRDEYLDPVNGDMVVADTKCDQCGKAEYERD